VDGFFVSGDSGPDLVTQQVNFQEQAKEDKEQTSTGTHKLGNQSD
jgi:hypothetical protein